MEKILIAKILKPQGLRGEVKVKTFNTKNTVIKKGLQVFLLNNKSLTISSCRERMGFLFLTFEGYEKIEEVETLRNEDLFVLEEHLDELHEDEYYVKDLIGCTVLLNTGKLIGTLTEIENYGASDVYTVKDGKKEITFTLVEGLILQVDMVNKQIVVDEQILEEVMV